LSRPLVGRVFFPHGVSMFRPLNRPLPIFITLPAVIGEVTSNP
jgi:hypothetical protein